MRLIYASIIALAVAIVPAALVAQDADRKVAGGGIAVKGWQGKIDAGAAKKGLTINDSKFAGDTGNLHLTVGPAASYWNPANVVKGDYTVKATFREAKTDTSHPHPYGIFIGGSGLGTDEHRLLYCVAYGDGTFLVRGFKGAQVMTVGKRAPNDAVHKHGADGGVTQEIAWKVAGGKARARSPVTTARSRPPTGSWACASATTSTWSCPALAFPSRGHVVRTAERPPARLPGTGERRLGAGAAPERSRRRWTSRRTYCCDIIVLAI
jgi:opacity protein-like surface antigen